MTSTLTQIKPYTVFQRNRLLPLPGTLNVRLGQQVSPVDIVAEASIPLKHYLVDVTRLLDNRNTAAAEKLITRRPGEFLEKNDILAETSGMFPRVIRTPGEGKIISIINGKVMIESERSTISLKAGLAGKVSQIIPTRGVTIECYGALVQGVWGNGLLGSGTLLIDPQSLDGEMKFSAFGANAAGAILLAGTINAEMMREAENEKISGLILGSLPSALIPLAQAQPYAVVVLNGFGKHGLDVLSRRVLLANQRHEVSINAVKWNRLTGDRPEVYIPYPAEVPDHGDFNSGQLVRLHSGAYAGRVGKIESLLPGLTLLPGGLRTNTARVLFGEDSREIIPLSNLDVILVSE